ncbi:uncharacterized protein LOC120394424 [Mauremys reevesii]|uniref:uncharacterized protein LOC120394424 n=1 Tax=Mauremys reevesii TaxID=260615 RepID=UPI00193EC3CB|nr:uncharacterized protein LOC120394424 [Mauremys reevesii]
MDSNSRVTRSQLSPAQHLNITGSASRSKGGEESTHTALSPSSQEICSAPGPHRAPTLYLNQMSAQPGDSVLLQCSVFSRVLATRVVFCKDGEEISSQKGSEKVIYSWNHTVSRGSSGNYSCGYKTKNRDNWASRSQLSPAKKFSITGSASSSGGAEEPTRTGPVMSPAIWAARCVLVLLLLVSAPIITFMLEKRGLPEPAGLHGGSSCILGGEGLGVGKPH